MRHYLGLTDRRRPVEIAPSPEAPALADNVSDAWIAFARQGDPNTPKLPRRVENDPIREQRLAMFSAMDLT